MLFLKKLFKVICITGISIFIFFLIAIQFVFSLKTDEDIRNDIEEVYISKRSFENFQIRVLATQKDIDTTKTTIIFIHGSPGSAFDYKSYFNDTELKSAFNLIAYDRVGYGEQNLGEVQDLAFEKRLLKEIINSLKTNNVILFGYSYGGPIALNYDASEIKKIVLLAPAVYSKVEPMFWFVDLYKFSITRFFMPKLLQAASKDKLIHKQELRLIEKNWMKTPNSIISLHGNDDWIVPLENSLYLENNFSPNKFELIVYDDVGHEILWTNFAAIKTVLLNL